MNQRGFTLLEVIVAMAIFSLLGLATYQTVSYTHLTLPTNREV